jgi:hypothetical protein
MALAGISGSLALIAGWQAALRYALCAVAAGGLGEHTKALMMPPSGMNSGHALRYIAKCNDPPQPRKM